MLVLPYFVVHCDSGYPGLNGHQGVTPCPTIGQEFYRQADLS